MSQTFQAAPSTPLLAPYATLVAQSRGRLTPEPPSPTRSPFQRDRDRIIHSGGFRKLRNKTQVFIESEGDYYRTRLTHSLEVAQIARSIARTLRIDEDLAETIALSHDLGHTCFGHAGEDGLSAAMEPYGGFNHNEQTFRILTKLENRYAAFDGLNLTWETLEGVVKHNGPVDHRTILPTLRAFNQQWDLELTTYAGIEAQVAALSDDIAYNTHDIDDGHRAGFFRLEDLSELPLFGPSLEKARTRYPEAARERLMYEAVREVIGLMVDDVLQTTLGNLNALQPQSAEEIRYAAQATVGFSPAMARNVETLRAFLHARVYRHSRINQICTKARQIVGELFEFFREHPDCLPSSWFNAVEDCRDDELGKARIIADYIAGMTDRFAVQEYNKLFSTNAMV
ncbi:MAG: deoxyguanosinetriphosphate triphosphohydrolase [Alphaproteobacteria bacterium]|nr:deoxyguanosinetriphosphate triphosphohydrolase [Alphaproteobacteria bacterium]